MYKISLNILVLLLAIASPAWARGGKGIMPPGAKPEKLAGDFKFTEGPAVDKTGNVYFTDQPNNKILKWSTDGKLSVFHDNAGRANGLYFDHNGNLLSCSDLENELWSISMNGEHQVLLKDYDNKRLNGPNDLWITPAGAIYFTDPLYPRPYWTTRTKEMQQDGQHVYYMTPDRKTVTRVATDLQQPNGIIGTPDGKKLYVADIKAGKTYVYNIQPDGTLADKKLFAPLGSDGMTIDNKGNIYLTGKGVTVFNPQGEQIAHIPVDAKWTANVCFGGKDGKTLFITASDSFFAIRMNVKRAK